MESAASNIIEIEHLAKRFGSLTAVDDVSFAVGRGELFAFLGVNGAGKSTTISMLCGTLDRDGGSIYVDGKNIDTDLDGIKRELGVVFQGSVLDKALGVRSNLKSRAALYGIFGAEFEKRYDELDEMLSLKELEKRSIAKLSGGQRRRADIARALIHKPKILILDEPTTGLDPQTRKIVWQVIETLRESDDMTVFLTTHYMEEAAGADNVVIIDAGKVAASGTPVELKNKYTGDFISFYGDADELAEKLPSLGRELQKIAGGYRIEVKDTAEATALITAHPELFTDYEVSKGNMDDVFLAATGKKLVGDEKA
ncbi:MAG: ABC transporter ATP-binding protein [Clostridiales bacterium]|nr:ABC transporter ATP-binding protein [Clostridiales bacterium]